MNAGIDTFMKAAKEYAVLTNEEEYLLAEQIHGDDPEAAKAALVTANLRFAMQMAHGYANSSTTPVEEFVAVALEAMVKKAGDFQPGIGKFITFIKPWIAKAFQEMHYDQMVAVPRHKQIQIKKVKRAIEQLTLENGPWAEITNEMVAERLNLAVSVVEDCIALNSTLLTAHASLSAPINGQDTDLTLLDSMADKHVVMDSVGDIGEQMEFALSMLGPLERQAITLSAGLDGHGDLKPKEMAEILGVSVAKVASIVKSARAKLSKSVAVLSALEFDMYMAAEGAEGYENMSVRAIADSHGVDVDFALDALASAQSKVAPAAATEKRARRARVSR